MYGSCHAEALNDYFIVIQYKDTTLLVALQLLLGVNTGTSIYQVVAIRV